MACTKRLSASNSRLLGGLRKAIVCQILIVNRFIEGEVMEGRSGGGEHTYTELLTGGTTVFPGGPGGTVFPGVLGGTTVLPDVPGATPGGGLEGGLELEPLLKSLLAAKEPAVSKPIPPAIPMSPLPLDPEVAGCPYPFP
jgi:hypothetical protein